MCGVARRHGLTPQQLFTWRREAQHPGPGECTVLRGVAEFRNHRARSSYRLHRHHLPSRWSVSFVGGAPALNVLRPPVRHMGRHQRFEPPAMVRHLQVLEFMGDDEVLKGLVLALRMDGQRNGARCPSRWRRAAAPPRSSRGMIPRPTTRTRPALFPPRAGLPRFPPARPPGREGR